MRGGRKQQTDSWPLVTRPDEEGEREKRNTTHRQISMNIRPLASIPPHEVPSDEFPTERDSEQDIDQELDDIAKADLPFLRRITLGWPDLLPPRDLRLAFLLTLYPPVVQLSLLFPIVFVPARRVAMSRCPYQVSDR